MISLSIRGLYKFDDTLFEEMVIPEELEQEDAIAAILMKCSEMEILYPDWNMMHESIGYWSRKHLHAWEIYYLSLNKEGYDPFNDYDRNEDYSEEVSTSGTTANSVNAFNESEAVQAASTEGTGSETRSHTLHQYGNSALGTNQDIIQKEIALRRKYNVYDLIAEDFKHEFCIQVY